MSTLILGSYQYSVLPTDINGSNLTVSVANTIPALSGGAGAPAAVPTYGAGTLYIDTTNFAIYVYASSAWNALTGGMVTTVAGTANQIATTAATGPITLSLANNAIMPGTASVTLTMGTTAQRPGAPADGMIRYNTTENIYEGYASPYTTSPSTGGLQRTMIYRKRKWWDDDFMLGSVASTGLSVYGDIGWSVSATSGTPANSLLTAIADHPGIFTLGTGGTSANNVRIHMGNLPTSGLVMANQVEYFSFLIRIPVITTIVTRCGLFNDLTTNASGTTYTTGCYFTFDPAVSANLQFFTSNAGTTSAAVNTVTVAANTWYLVEAFYNGTTWTPVVNQIVYTAQSTNIPAAVVNVGLMIQTSAASARTVQIDMFSMHTAELGNRYP